MSDSLVIENSRSCAFTGHRIIGERFDLTLLKDLVGQFIEQGFTTFYCGMAMGFDLIAADVVLEQKKLHPELRLIACVPCPNQEKNFPAEERRKYRRIISACDAVELISDSYYRGCMLVRDRFMVDCCERVIAYLDRNEGGTAYTVRYAKSKNKDIYII